LELWARVNREFADEWKARCCAARGGDDVMAATAAARTKRRPSVLRAVLVPGELPMGDAVLARATRW